MTLLIRPVHADDCAAITAIYDHAVRHGTASWEIDPPDQAEMDRVFNQGIGLVMIVSSYYAESIQRQLEAERQPTYLIGEVREGEPGVEFLSVTQS